MNTLNSNHNYQLLKKDLDEGKRIVLFLGAGINYCQNRRILWADVMQYLFRQVILKVAAENRLSEQESSLLKQVFNLNTPNTGFPPVNPEAAADELKQYIYDEFPFTLQTYIVKSYLGDRYIPLIQDFIYSKIDGQYIEKAFRIHHALQKGTREEQEATSGIQGLFEIARLILLCPNIQAVVTYNYDNLLTQAIHIIQKNPETYFTPEEMERYRERASKSTIRTTPSCESELLIEDIYGDRYNKSLRNNILPIYHVHGYIPSPSEIRPMKEQAIVLSMDEFYDNLRNAYCWQTDTQMHFLSHYTCIFIGSSMSDLTIQRMLYNVQQHGNDDRIYCFQAYKPIRLPETEQKIHQVLCHVKQDFFQSYGISIIYNERGYPNMYEQINRLITIKDKQI